MSDRIFSKSQGYPDAYCCSGTGDLYGVEGYNTLPVCKNWTAKCVLFGGNPWFRSTGFSQILWWELVAIICVVLAPEQNFLFIYWQRRIVSSAKGH